jgi:predicted DNA-binding protein with PD1-like motif
MRQLSFRLKPGDDLKKEIIRRTKEAKISAGVLLSIVGGLERATLRMAGSTPENQIVKTWDGPFEIVSGTGTFSKDGPHIHVTLSDQTGGVVGGHLKDDCIVKLTVEVVIGIFDDVTYERTLDSATGFPELNIKQK